MRSLSASALAEGAKGAALTIALSLVFAFLPVVSIAVVPLLPLPSAYVCVRHGPWAAVVSAAAASLLAGIVTGIGSGLLTFGLAGVSGVVLGVALRRGWGFSRVLLSTAVATAVGMVAWLGGVWAITGMTVAQLQSLMDTSFQAVSEMYAGMNVDAAAVAQAEESARNLLAMVPYLMPGILCSMGVVVAAVALALASLVFPRLGLKSTPGTAFHEFRLHWATPYGFIVGLALLLVAGLLSQGAEAVRLVGINVAIFFFTLFFVQGFAVTRWVMVEREVRGGAAAALYAAVLIGQVFFQLLSWLGILDCWLDFRKRMTPKTVRAPHGGPGGHGGKEDQEEM